MTDSGKLNTKPYSRRGGVAILYEELAQRVEQLFAWGKVSRWIPVGRGYTPAEHWILEFESGASAFIKIATHPTVIERLRMEHQFYSQVSASYMPRLLGWDDNGVAPLLGIEDLRSAHWPPPWTKDHIEAVLKGLEEVRKTRPPATLKPIDSSKLRGWGEVANNPRPFLSLKLCSESWLNETLPRLLDSEEHAPLGGDELIHFDVRSDNICIKDDRAILVDWDLACRANGLFDLAFWLPSLQLEGGPPPEAVHPEANVFASTVSGFFAARAGLPQIPHAPGVRDIQLKQLCTSLPWAIRVLGLAPLDLSPDRFKP